MSASNRYVDEPSNHIYIPTHPSISTDSHDVKASYDDLIDEYGMPYAPNGNHQTFTLDTPQHRRGPSISQKPSKQDTLSSARGYPPLPTDREVAPQWSWRKLIPESLACRLYIIVVLVQTTIDIAIEVDLFLRINAATKDEDTQDNDPSKKMSTYLVLFGMAHVFQFAMAVDAVYFRNTLEFMCLTGFNSLLLVYSIIQISEVKEVLQNTNRTTGDGISNIPINVLTIIVPCVVGVAELVFVLLAWKIYHEFGWKVYKFLGADRRIKKMYATYQIYECIVKFDIFFWAGFSVQFIVLVLSEGDWEYYVTCAALPLSLLLLFEGHLAARYENKWMMATFMSGCVGAMIYFTYKFVKVLLNRNSGEFQFIWRSLTEFSLGAIILLLLTFTYSIIVMRNFGRGLREALSNRSAQRHNRIDSKGHHRAASANPNRMSID